MSLVKFKVFKTVISTIPVLVVNALKAGQRPTKRPLHHQPVFHDAAPMNLEPHISARRYGTMAVLATLLAFAWFLHDSSVAHLHHTGVACGGWGRSVCLPLADNSWAVNQLKATGELTWCVNGRAARYPNFVAQVYQANDAAAAALGIRHRQIPGTYETAAQALAAGCQIQHNMPEVHGCDGCAGWIHYLNRPVLIEYKWQLGYTDWRTTVGHEMGHAYGLHEHYDDAAFRSHRNNFGYWAHGLTRDPGTASDSPTVMDSGTGVWALTSYDVAHICQNIDRFSQRFSGCGFSADPCEGPTDAWGNYWDNCRGRWVAPTGWLYEPVSGVWETPAGVPEWTACNGDGLRWNLYLNAWAPVNSGFYTPPRGLWSFSPPC